MALTLKGNLLMAGKAAEIRAALNLPDSASVALGATKTLIVFEDGVSLSIPYGVATVSGASAATALAACGIAPGASAAAHAPLSASQDADEEWAYSVAPDVLPETRQIAQATQMYQRVFPAGGGTSGCYTVAFVGPNLLGVVRVQGAGVSVKFRGRYTATPSEAVRSILADLNVSGIKAEYISAHVNAGREINASLLRGILGGFYAALHEHIATPFPDVNRILAA